MYAEDSFFTLTVPGRIGLICVTLVLSAAVIGMARRLTSGLHGLVRCMNAVVLFWAFVWLSPQLYYLYYLQVFEHLPLQNVIPKPPSPVVIANLLVFRAEENLAAHGQGVLAWMMITAALCNVGNSDQRSVT